MIATLEELELLKAERARMVMTLRRLNITDTRVLSAMETTPREDFVPDIYRKFAYDNLEQPLIMENYTMTAPSTIARVLSLLELEDNHKVLEIGTGSGYQTAILAKLCARVYTVEWFQPLGKHAEKTFYAQGIKNIVCAIGDGSRGWPLQNRERPILFDRILINASTNKPGRTLFDHLSPHGFVVIPLGIDVEQQHLFKLSINRLNPDMPRLVQEKLFKTSFEPMMEDHSRQDRPTYSAEEREALRRQGKLPPADG